MTKVEVKLPGTNMVISGDRKEVLDFFKAQGHDLTGSGEYYLSDSLGLLKVEDMDPNHLRNAIRKEWKRWMDELYAANYSNQELATRLTDTSANKLLMKMLTTLYKK